MTDDFDPQLANLFAERTPELECLERENESEAFTADVMARMGVLRFRTAAIGVAATAIVLCVAGLFVMPLQELALLLARGLTTSLVDIADEGLALVLSPVNSVASVLVLGVKLVRMGQKKMLGTARAG